MNTPYTPEDLGDLIYQATEHESPPPEKLTSITNVNIENVNNPGVWGNKRTVMSARIDKGLYKAFKPVARQYYGSVCNALESFMAGIVGVNQNPNVNSCT